ncbi:alpha/beta fold hydrolase [Streptomyces sp. BPTC-684]|uniref:alpha/beta hydrolase n=1 Tax=Streptomyces sp. BPTC-684 TaxID=3043734 RepID=UPI0024B09517|nr:alpha/beta fold hydrolase [Streptomyces sp. BPTC-684]WHM41008.1 alpha/beta fold hydrolase [Streptomyces sp. BPTC-684]
MKRTPVVFIHGAWLHALSWEPWVERFATRGFRACAPGWPGEGPVRELREAPETLGRPGLDALTVHYTQIVQSCDTAPVIVGHSVGGLIAQRLIAADMGRAAVAIAPAPINDIPLPASFARLPAVAVGGSGGPSVSLSPQVFHRVFANTVTAEEARRLYERYIVPAPSRLLTDLGYGAEGRSPHTVVDVGNAARGPLLLVSGQEDRLVPDAATRAAYKQYGDTTAVTDLKQFADRAHSLVIDGGWHQVADHVLGWLDEQGVRARSSEG